MSCNINENKEEFVKLLKSTGREGVDDVIEELERLGFFSAPASAGHHLNVEGGSCSIPSTPARRHLPSGKA